MSLHRLDRTDRLDILLAAAVAVLALALLGPAFDNELVSDDWVFVYRGAVADGVDEVFDEVPPGWFSRPAIWLLSFGLVRLGGFDPLPYRLLLTVLHLLNTALVGLLAFRLVRLWPEALARQVAPRRVALAAAAFFVVHSLNHEVLYWYAAVTDGLIVSLRLVALCWLAESLRSEAPSKARIGLAAPLAASLTLAALLTKEAAVVVPLELALLAAVDALRRGALRPGRRLALAGAAVVGSGSVTLAWLGWYLSSGGATRAGLTVLELGPAAWLLRLGQAVGRLVLFGTLLMTQWQVVLILLVVAAGLVLALRRRQRFALFAQLWLCLALLPTIAITAASDAEAGVPVLQRLVGLAGDHYYYGPSAALGLALAAAGLASLRVLPSLLRPMAPPRRTRAVLRVVGSVVLAGWILVHAQRLWRLESEWDRAGELLVATRLEIAEELALPVEDGEIVCVEERPDSYRGRYILRSGVTELIRLRAGHERFVVLAPPWTAGAACTRHLALGDALDGVERAR